MKTVKHVTCLVLPILWSLGSATTSVHEDQRNGIDVTVRCETDILYAVIIWYIGNKRSVPDRYDRNGRLATATETIPVTETIQVICIAQNRSTSEQSDTLILRPHEVSTDPPTVVTSLATDTDDDVPAGTHAGTLPTNPNVSTNYGDENVTVAKIPTPPSGEEDDSEKSTHIYVVIGIVGVVVLLCSVAAVLVAIAYCHKRVQIWRPTSTPPEQTHHNSGVHGPQSRDLYVPLDDSGSLATNPTDEPKIAENNECGSNDEDAASNLGTKEQFTGIVLEPKKTASSGSFV